MKEIISADKNYKHKVYVDSSPLFSLMSKQEKDLFVAILELEIRDYYKDQQSKQDGNNFGQPP